MYPPSEMLRRCARGVSCAGSPADISLFMPLQMDKHTLVERLGIPYRDLRQMDPFIAQPYPAAILVREKAIVLSLENIRLITSKVWHLDPNPSP